MTDEYKDKYLDEKFSNLVSTNKRIEKKLDENSKDTKEAKDEIKDVNSRLYKVEGEVFGKGTSYSRMERIENEIYHDKETKIKDLPPLWRDPPVMNVLKLFLITVIVVTGAIILVRTGFNIFETLL